MQQKKIEPYQAQESPQAGQSDRREVVGNVYGHTPRGKAATAYRKENKRRDFWSQQAVRREKARTGRDNWWCTHLM